MNPKKTTVILLMVFSLGWMSCKDSSGPKGNESSDSSGLNAGSETLKLTEGMQIVLQQQVFDQENNVWAEKTHRTLVIENPGDAEGLSLSWYSPHAQRDIIPGQEIIMGSGTPPPSTGLPPDVGLLPQNPPLALEGKLSLPNIMNSRQMTFPLFWPAGDLYLSNSSGIWLSDAAFKELREDSKTQWNTGLLENAILGPLQDLHWFEIGLRQLARSFSQDEAGKEGLQRIELEKKNAKFSIKINGVQKDIKVMVVENPLARYVVLNLPQNPLILEASLSPHASPAQILFSPLGLIKGLVDYKVVEINPPATTHLSVFPGN